MVSDIESRIADWFSAQPGFGPFELAGLTVRKHGKRSFVEVLLDRKSGLVTLDECGRWNRALSDWLDQADLFQGPYLVEISSPGADRPLERQRDFERAAGRTVKVRYREGETSIREFTGRLERADANGIVLKSKDQELVLAYGRIQQAKQEITFSKETN